MIPPDSESDDLLDFHREPTRPVPVLRILLGIIAGLLVGQFAIWWLPKTPSDPLGIAARLPRGLAFLVPEDLRTPAKKIESSSNSSEALDPELFTSRTNDTEDDSGTALSSVVPPFALPPEVRAETVTSTGPITHDEKNDPIGALIEECTRGMRDLDSTDLPERKRVAKKLYDDLCDLGSRLILAESEQGSYYARSTEEENEKWRLSQAHLVATRALLSAIATAPEKRVFVATSAGKLALSDEQGITIAGGIHSIREEIDGWILGVADHRQKYSVHVPHSAMKEQIKNGDKVVVLGIVSRPPGGNGPIPRIISAAHVLAPR